MVRIATFASVLACKSIVHPVAGYMIRLMLTYCLPVAVSVMALTPNVSGAKDVGNGAGQQFTTGGCVADADCRSTCCAEISASGLGICSAVGASTQNGKLGCGFTDPNATVRIALFSLIYNAANRIPGCHCGCQGSSCQARFQVQGINGKFTELF